MIPKKMILLVVLFYFYWGCNNYFFYQPTRKFYYPPEKLRLNYEEFYINGIDKNKIHAWLFPAPSGKPLATVVQFHGNAENMSSHYISLVWLLKHNFEIFTFDYRGYGRSLGEPSTEKIIADSKLVLKFLQNRNKKKKRRLILYGQSIGGITAARSLGEMQDRSLIAGLVLEGSFSSYRSIGKQTAAKICLPIGGLAYLILQDRYSIRDILPKLSPIHIIVVHGTNDSVVPYTNGREIFMLAKQPKEFLEIPGGGHIDWHNIKSYFKEREILASMLKSVVR